ncbi:peptide/nickel transport system substrate-binding protein [Arthrobacter sp. SLBN-100]|uniref:ABC transporter substrate-binding protein n=1 Tax=Arthrobacter sp. SLBN-100 TaxID=2768450 RepID=UPI0011529666|nr:ABC transporter substrate-binding protein [Arthrobacter sp. SLBN-100]TQJ66235.1 peptide/nickel transport system substrate-binding protein [Arthrobacter sp. SLBN-100]
MKLLNATARGSSAVLAGALLLGSLTACGGSSAPTTAKADTRALTLAVEFDSASFGYDPLRGGSSTRPFFEGLYESLMTLQPDGSVGPGLATAFTYNADNTVLTLTLKDGVTFTDGSKLDAGLVKANLDRRSDPALTGYSAIAKGGAQEITSVDVVSPTQVALTFAKPQPGFEQNLASTTGMIVGKNGAADTASLAATPDGSGPYTLDPSTVKGNKYVMVKNEKSPEASKYAFDKVIFSVVTDPQARANALVSGQADVAQLMSSTVDFAKSKGAGVSRIGGTVNTLISFDKIGKTSPAFAEEKVRRAFNYAIDRKALVDALHKGDTPAWNALPKDSPGFTTDLETEYAYNPEKAKALLAEAGYPNGFEFTMVGAAAITDLPVIQKDLAAVGITMNIKVPASTDELFASVATTPMGYPPLNWDNPAGVMYGTILNGFTNVQKATDEQLSAATAEVAAAKDDNARKIALTKLNKRLVESGWMIPIYEALTNQGYNTKKVAPVEFAGTNAYPLLSSYKPAS